MLLPWDMTNIFQTSQVIFLAENSLTRPMRWIVKNGGCCNRAKIASCQFKLRSTNIEDDSRLNVKARGFNRQGQVAFFDIRIAHLNAESNNSQPTEKVLLRLEKEKKREYNRRVLEIEHEAVTPLVFGSNGAMGKECIIHKTIAMKIANKQDTSYTTVMSRIRTNLNIL